MGIRKVKAYKKLSMRKRMLLESKTHFGKHPSGQRSIRFDHAVDKFIRAGSCRHKRPLGSPCTSFDVISEGTCKRDGRICDLLTEKGERYQREYE